MPEVTQEENKFLKRQQDAFAVLLSNGFTPKEAEALLCDPHDRWRLALEGSQSGIWDWDIQTDTSFFSDRWYQMAGYEPNELPASRQTWESLVHPEDLPTVNRAAADHMEGKTDSYTCEVRMKHKEGHYIWIEVRATAIRNSDGDCIRLVGSHIDITKRKSAEQARAATEEKFQAISAASSTGLVVQNSDGTIAYCNPSATKILGLTQEQMAGRTSLDPRWRAIRENGAPFPGEEHPAMITLATKQIQENVVMGIHKPSGELTWISVSTALIYHPETKEIESVAATFHDITELKATHEKLDDQVRKLHETQIELEVQQKELVNANEKLHDLASSDYLTGLKNRRSFMERLDAELALSKRHRTPFSLIIFDIDHFKILNDTHGHIAGDEVLVEVASLLKECCRRSDFAARFGGEEFAVILPHTDTTGAAKFANKLIAHLKKHDWNIAPITVSAGYAEYGSEYDNPVELIAAADRALYLAKENGRDQAVAATLKTDQIAS